LPLEGISREDRFARLASAISVHPKRGVGLQGRSVLIVDDVMTSGATLAASTEAAFAAGAKEVCICVLARAVKDA
jgi:predicted amidophosphoribosyltransferase